MKQKVLSVVLAVSLLISTTDSQAAIPVVDVA